MSEVLAKNASSSNPSKIYEVIRGGDGVVYCTCPGWKMRKDCKHLKAFHGGNTPPTPAGVATTLKPKPSPAKTATKLPTDGKPINPAVFSSDAFQSMKWYQGCAGVLGDGQGTPQGIEDDLGSFEKAGDHFAEPKLDGIWIIAFADGNQVRFWSRNCKEKGYGLSNWKLPAGTALIGELGFGTEHATERRAAFGHDFMDVFSVLISDYKPTLHLGEDDRRKQTEAFMASLNASTQERFRLVPRFDQNFVKEYHTQHEGLVLKLKGNGKTQYRGGGIKVPHWLKAKKWMEADMVIMDRTISKAGTKTTVPMIEALVCGQYVKGQLKSLVRVGSMTNEWSVEFAANFPKYKGQVITIAHFGQFKSGALRHPSMMRLREDKDPAECVFE